MTRALQLVSLLFLLAISAAVERAALVSCAGSPAGRSDEAEKRFVEWIERVKSKADASAEVDGISSSDVQFHSLATTTTRTIYVDKNGNGDFKSINKAIKSIPNGNTDRVIILVGPGTFKERFTIKKDKGPVTLQGSGNRETTVSWNLNAERAGGTFKSASVSVFSDDFVAKDIAFENTSPSPPPGAVGQQAVAFMISGDKAEFYRVAFLGYQDTLYDRYGRHYFKDCYIRGSIDFIFGDGQSFYETCYLESVATSFGSLSAHKRMSKEDDGGYVFSECTVKGTGYLYLSRAWGEYSRVVFIKTYFDGIIRPEGWSDWEIAARQKTVFYGEYKCYGPGANRQGREPWSHELSDSQVKPFLTKESWIGNWVSNGN